MTARNDFSDASKRTIEELRAVARTTDVQQLSQLSLPQIEEVVEQIGVSTPAGSVARVILNGLAKLPDRTVTPDRVRSDTNSLLRALENVKDRAVYGTFFAGPATVIWGYQNLLKLAGKDPDDSFPEGYWQFYVDYALREDTARHTNETNGFDGVLNRHQISLDQIDRITSWVMAGIHTVHQYPELLRNEWRERVYLGALRSVTSDLPNADYYARLYRQWERKRPYRRGSDVRPGDTYSTYRRSKFDSYLEYAMRDLSSDLRYKWIQIVRKAKADEMGDYQKQMSILAYLSSDIYGETRVPFDITETQIGIVFNGRYYLVPACRLGSDKPADVTVVRAQIASIVNHVDSYHQPVVSLTDWPRVLRGEMPALREQVRMGVMAEMDRLNFAPIILNMDAQPYHLTLSRLRQAERGIGSHAMTVFDIGESFVFDQSHIFFDGTWGAALAEIMTNEATAWGVYLNTLPKIHPPVVPIEPLDINFTADELAKIDAAPKVKPEVSAESEGVNLRNLLALRRVFKLRSDLIKLTVNDLLVLYRSIHAYTYQADPQILADIGKLLEDPETAAIGKMVLDMVDPALASNPSILIPVDASRQNPRDRLHPMNFQVPVHELNLLQLHDKVMSALNQYKNHTGERNTVYQDFDGLQRQYLTALAGFGAVFLQAKLIAETGGGTSVGSIKLLAHLPVPLQRLLDKIPSRFEILNDIIKGREVFSNIGAISPTSSLLRFMSAKDDNLNKDLAWGVLTDSENVMRITLRDFRPHVQALSAIGYEDLAVRITQDYLNAYASGLNDYVRDLRRITMASRETRLVSDVGAVDVRSSR